MINGGSDLFVGVFGEAGRHARSAVGMGSLPGDITVEIEAILEFAVTRRNAETQDHGEYVMPHHARTRDIRRELGLRPIINVSGTMTSLGASIMVPEADRRDGGDRAGVRRDRPAPAGGEPGRRPAHRRRGRVHHGELRQRDRASRWPAA